MHNTLEKEHVDELENYAGKWKNLYFEKSGATYLGRSTFVSEAAAKDFLGCYDLACDIGPCLCGHVICWSNYSHTIQIPTGE